MLSLVQRGLNVISNPDLPRLGGSEIIVVDTTSDNTSFVTKKSGRNVYTYLWPSDYILQTKREIYEFILFLFARATHLHERVDHGKRHLLLGWPKGWFTL